MPRLGFKDKTVSRRRRLTKSDPMSDFKKTRRPDILTRCIDGDVEPHSNIGNNEVLQDVQPRWSSSSRSPACQSSNSDSSYSRSNASPSSNHSGESSSNSNSDGTQVSRKGFCQTTLALQRFHNQTIQDDQPIEDYIPQNFHLLKSIRDSCRAKCPQKEKLLTLIALVNRLDNGAGPKRPLLSFPPDNYIPPIDPCPNALIVYASMNVTLFEVYEKKPNSLRLIQEQISIFKKEFSEMLERIAGLQLSKYGERSIKRRVAGSLNT